MSAQVVQTPSELFLEQQRSDKALARRCLAEHEDSAFYLANVTEVEGLRVESFNIRRPDILCPNGCAHCPVPAVLAHFGHGIDAAPDNGHGIDAVIEMPEAIARSKKGWRRVDRHKIIRFPTTSDLFANNAETVARQCVGMVAAGHEVFITTKNKTVHVRAVTDAIEASGVDRSKIHYWIKYGSNAGEPNTATPDERIRTINVLVARGWSVSVIMTDNDTGVSASDLLAACNGIVTVNTSDPVSDWSIVAEEPRMFLKREAYAAMLDLLY